MKETDRRAVFLNLQAQIYNIAELDCKILFSNLEAESVTKFMYTHVRTPTCPTGTPHARSIICRFIWANAVCPYSHARVPKIYAGAHVL